MVARGASDLPFEPVLPPAPVRPALLRRPPPGLREAALVGGCPSGRVVVAGSRSGSVPGRFAPGYAPSARGERMRTLLRLGPLVAAFWFGSPAAQAAHCGLCRYPAPC